MKSRNVGAVPMPPMVAADARRRQRTQAFGGNGTTSARTHRSRSPATNPSWQIPSSLMTRHLCVHLDLRARPASGSFFHFATRFNAVFRSNLAGDRDVV